MQGVYLILSEADMPGLLRVFACLFLADESRATFLQTRYQPIHLQSGGNGDTTHLTPQGEGRCVGKRPLRAQLVCELLRRRNDRVSVVFPLARDDSLVELVGNVEHRRKCRRIVVDAGVDEDATVPAVALCRWGEAIDAACFDVYRGDLRAVVCGEDGELDCAAPGGRAKYCVYVLVAWSA